ncbi:uncharacterized protein LOC113360574 [Papaver somniferum]|uniref:uncharacterized protein LOC113360574 n=1 Tax=Papaver somniferum TaxID=3469 RepID=UPI000E6F631D|nr:uncharacterized protein LOC113360574 [Papaver somniferum]
MLKQKSRNKWLVEGAGNTNFFHNSIRMRRSSNTISELVDANGVTVTYCDQIRDLMVGYYEAKFNGDDAVPVDSLFDIEHDSLSDEERNRTDHFPTVEEIHVVVFGLDADSAPGPDGFASFFIGIAGRSLRMIWKGINIHENISLASYIVNEMKIKRKDDNVGLKLDITQAFDTVRWPFVMEVFRRYGFSDDWCNWILQILKSSRISVLVNGSPEGFFSVDRGLRQGDPLSPLIVVLTEDVLSRNIMKLFREGSMTTMATIKGNMKSLRNLMALLSSYQKASGQTVSRKKSKLYYGGCSLRRRRRATISEFLGMNSTSFPDSNVVEKIKEQLAGWKGRMLSFQDRVMLVKSVIASYFIHNMVVYKWPTKFIHQCEVAICNFLLSGDSKVSKSFVVAYDKVCSLYSEGGLGITQMRVMNKVMLMKLCWKICTSQKVWVRFLSAKFFSRNGLLVGYTKSSIFPGFRLFYADVELNTRVLIGDGRFTFLYFGSWWGDTSIADILGLNDLDRQVRAIDMILNGEWEFTDQALNTFLAAGIVLDDLPVPMGGVDCKVWKSDIKAQFSVISAKDLIPRDILSLMVLLCYGVLLFILLLLKEIEKKTWSLCNS